MGHRKSSHRAQPVSLSMPGSSATFVGRGRPWVALVRSSTGTRSPACCQCGHTASVDRAPAADQPGRLAGPGARECFSAKARQGAKVSPVREGLICRSQRAATSNACARVHAEARRVASGAARGCGCGRCVLHAVGQIQKVGATQGAVRVPAQLSTADRAGAQRYRTAQCRPRRRPRMIRR
jgi:hypothetical protein